MSGERGEDHLPRTAILIHHDTNLYNLRIHTTANHTAIIHTTSNHPFWDTTTRHWVKAASLPYGDHLRTPDHHTATAAGGWTPRHHTAPMWDLTVTRDHDFYIAATPTTSILVHNCGGFRNLEPENKAMDLAEARAVGVSPSEPGTAEFDSHIATGEVKWGIRADGSLRVVPTDTAGTEIYHSVLNGDMSAEEDRLLAAGTAQIERTASGYIGRQITNYSGHYQPSEESVQLGVQAFARYGIDFEQIDTI